jgi:ribosomal protein S18 acetylase RimI-like enzyme
LKRLKVRPADDNDVPTLVALAEKFMPKMASARERTIMLRRAMRNPDYELLVAEFNREIVGFIDRWDIYDLAEGAILSYVENLYVIPRFRRRGVGGELLQKIVESAKRKGAREIHVFTELDNKLAISLYKKHGFVKRGLQLEMEL